MTDAHNAEEYWDAINQAAEAKATPRKGPRRGGRSTPHRKALQLCHQVAETLNFVLSGECDDDVLRNLYVVRVDPAPDVGQMMVTVAPLDPNDIAPAEKVIARLAHATPKLRREVASSIHRAKTPQLLFRVIAPPTPEPRTAPEPRKTTESQAAPEPGNPQPKQDDGSSK